MDALLAAGAGVGVVLEEPAAARGDAGAPGALRPDAPGSGPARRGSRDEFDRALGPAASPAGRLHGAGNGDLWPARCGRCWAPGVRDDATTEAIALVLDPERNRYLGEALNVSTPSASSARALSHARYTFRGSGSPRRRLPGPAPPHDTGVRAPSCRSPSPSEPDYATPGADPARSGRRARYRDRRWSRAWEAESVALGSLRSSDEFALYLLPNAVDVRFTESADLLNLRHKLTMRLCYNAQEERTAQASWEEALQIRERDPRIGSYLLPPCTLRLQAGTTPYCPEGRRYCGKPVWSLPIGRYRRTI